jgi:hypothetical protein
MGGRGSGGRRVGSGRKGKLATVLPHPSASAAAIAAIDTVDPPAELQGSAAEFATLTSQLVFLRQADGPGEANPQIEELETRVAELQAQALALAIWRELAPRASATRTLTPATAAAFAMLCRAVVLERALSASASTAGGANHRGLMHRVATWMKDFCLSPFGKPLTVAAPATPVVSKWAGALK